MIGRTSPASAAARRWSMRARPRPAAASISHAGGNAHGKPVYDDAAGFGFEPGDATRFSVHAARRQLPCHRVAWRRGRCRRHRPCSPNSADSWSRTSASGRRKPLQRSFIVNVRTPDLGQLPANATGGTRVRLKPREVGSATWDDKLTLEFDGTAPQVLRRWRSTPSTLPTLYLAGDSTVTDQPMAPNASWGQMLPRFFAPRIAVANHAESGETLKSFVTEQRLDKLLSNAARRRLGDDPVRPQRPEDRSGRRPTPRRRPRIAPGCAPTSRRCAAAARRPILVTSPERRNFDARATSCRRLGDYPAGHARRRARGRRRPDRSQRHEPALLRGAGPGARAARLRRRRAATRRISTNTARYALARMVVEGTARRGSRAHRGSRAAPRRGRRPLRPRASDPLPTE